LVALRLRSGKGWWLLVGGWWLLLVGGWWLVARDSLVVGKNKQQTTNNK
jgi:hypothetical protein